MRVVDLGERQRQRRAAVADARLPGDLLRFVQVAEGDVGDRFGEQAGRQRLGVADDDVALGVLGHRGPGHVRMADGDQCLIGRALRFGGGDQLAVHLVDAGQIVVADLAAGHLGRAQERQGQAPGTHRAVGAMQRQQQARAIQVAVVQPVHPA
ncbi:hypothetical protein D3C85_1144370 [compost metagenome]